jgi:hypothetical protein
MTNKIYLTAIFALSVICVFLYLHIRNQNDKIASRDSVIQEKEAEIAYRKTESGRIMSEKVAAEVTAKDLATAYPKAVAELKEEFGIRLKDIKAYVRNEIQAQGKGEGTTINNYYEDSTKTTRFRQEMRIDDGYLRMEAVILDTNRYTYSYLYSDTITTVLSAKRKWFLGNEKIVATSSLRNPNARVTGTTNILINDRRDKRWVISAGVYYDPFRQTYGASVNFGYALIKF